MHRWGNVSETLARRRADAAKTRVAGTDNNKETHPHLVGGAIEVEAEVEAVGAGEDPEAQLP